MRVKINNILIILGFVIFFIEYYFYVKKGRYFFCILKNRINKILLEVLIVDMKKEILEGNKFIFSRFLLNEIENNLKKGE